MSELAQFAGNKRLRDGIVEAVWAASLAIEAGSLYDDIVVSWATRFGRAEARRLSHDRAELKWLRDELAGERVGWRGGLADLAAIAATVGERLVNSAAIVFKTYCERPDVLTCLRLATDHPATLVSGLTHDSYFDAAHDYILERASVYEFDDRVDGIFLTERREAFTRMKHLADDYASEEVCKRFPRIAGSYLASVPLEHVTRYQAMGFTASSDLARRVTKEGQRATGIPSSDFGAEYKALHSDRLKGLAPETIEAVELYQSVLKPRQVAARMNLSAANARQIKSRAKRRGLLDS